MWRPAFVSRRWSRWLNRRLPECERVVLSQRDIFIFLSWPGCCFLGFNLMIAVASFNFQNNLGLVLAFFLASMGFLSQYLTFRNCNGLVLSATAGPPVYAGEDAHFIVHVRGSDTREYQALQFGLDQGQLGKVPIQDSCDVATGEESRVRLTLTTSKRGWLAIPRVYFCTWFPFGWLRCWSWPLLHARVLVYPRPIELATWPVMEGEGDGDAPHRQPGSEDFDEHKRYQIGDSSRQIDWKAYARERGLLTRHFVAQSGSEYTFRLQDLPVADREMQLSWLCSLLLQAEAGGMRYALQLPEFYSGVAQGDLHLATCLEALALA